jgi:hypothetical protein
MEYMKRTTHGLDNMAFSYCMLVSIAFVEGQELKLLNTKLATSGFFIDCGIF